MVPQADAGTNSVNIGKGDGVGLEGALQLGLRGAMNFVSRALEFATGAASHFRVPGEVALRPVEKSQSGVAERR